MIEPDLAVGVHVRHDKQPAWGIGVVVSLARSAAHVDVVVAFDAVGEKKLRLTQNLFTRVTDDEVAQAAAAAAAAERAQKAAAKAAKKAAQPSTSKPQTLTPAHTIAGRFSDAGVVGGHIVVVGDGGAVSRYDGNANGGVIGGAPNCWPELWGGVDDVLIGHSRHGDHSWVVVNNATGRARSWKPPRDVGLPRTRRAGAGRFVLWGHRELFVIDNSGNVVADVPVASFVGAEQHLTEVYAHGDGFAAEVFGPAGAADNFHVVGFGADGVVRFCHAGFRSGVAGDLILLVQQRTCLAVDVTGAVVARVDDVMPNSGFDHEDGFVADRGDVVCTANDQVMRFDPMSGAVRYRAAVPHAHQPPVIAGRVAAIGAHLYGDHAKDVSFIDVDDGHVIGGASAAAGVSRCVAVDVGAFALQAFAKKLIVWRKLDTTAPEKLTLPHDDQVMDVVSPAPGVVVTRTKDGLFFWRV